MSDYWCLEASAQNVCLKTGDSREGQAVVEKRAPTFGGR
jgi:hypothetical protein